MVYSTSGPLSIAHEDIRYVVQLVYRALYLGLNGGGVERNATLPQGITRYACSYPTEGTREGVKRRDRGVGDAAYEYAFFRCVFGNTKRVLTLLIFLTESSNMYVHQLTSRGWLVPPASVYPRYQQRSTQAVSERLNGQAYGRYS